MSRYVGFLAAAAGMAFVSSVTAQASITVDGTLDSGYGSPLAVQTIQTSFGDTTTGTVDTAGGSELDAAYGTIQNGTLYLMLTGNLQTNYNKLDVFIDSVSGQGMNQLVPLSQGDQGNFSKMATGGVDPITFDTGVAPDYWFAVTAGGSPTGVYVDYADLDAGQGYYAGTTNPGAANPALTGGAGGPTIQVGFNDSNNAGIGGSTGTAADATAAQAVTTGVELAISLADLGNPTGPIMVSAFINGSNEDYLANQFLGGLPVGTGSLGNTSNANGFDGDLNNYAGNQYFTVAAAVPEPASLALVAIGGLLLTMRRRKQQMPN